MDQNIRNAFDEVHMREDFSDALLQQIRLEQLRHVTWKKQQRKRYAAIAAVLALVTVLLAINPNVVTAVEQTVQQFTNREPPRRRMAKDEYLFRDPAVRVKRLKEDYTVHGELPVNVHPWLQIIDHRLYYVDYRDDRVRVDLTDLLSEEEAVYLSFVDDYGMTHYIAVGGSYGGEETLPATVGFLELLWNPFQVIAYSDGTEVPQPGVDDFICRNELKPDSSGQRRAWFESAKKYYKSALPWPDA